MSKKIETFSKSDNASKGASTVACQAGVTTDKNFDAVIAPVYLTSTYEYPQLGTQGDYIYSRGNNPTRNLFGETLAELEGGYGASVTSSGIAAVNLIFHLLEADDTLFIPRDCYGGTYRLVKAKAEAGHLNVRYVDPTDLEDLAKAFEEGKPKLILVETPSNPILRITDIQAVCDLAHSHDCLVAIDNTFLSPVFQKPFELGVDIVMHSTTKIINGHSDMLGGAVICKTQELHEKLAWWNNCLGSIASAFDCYLALRGLRTLEVRAKQQAENAQALAEFLENHEAVEAVYYPGLESHPQHDIAKKQQSGFGTMVSIELKEKRREKVAEFVEQLQIYRLAESLGGIESLLCHPPTMTHQALNDEELEQAGIAKGLLRLSVGLENIQDQIADWKNALQVLDGEDYEQAA